MTPRVFPNIVRKPPSMNWILSKCPFCDLISHSTDDEILCNFQNEDNVELVSGAVFPARSTCPKCENEYGYKVKAVAVFAYKQMRCRAELGMCEND